MTAWTEACFPTWITGSCTVPQKGLPGLVWILHDFLKRWWILSSNQSSVLSLLKFILVFLSFSEAYQAVITKYHIIGNFLTSLKYQLSQAEESCCTFTQLYPQKDLYVLTSWLLCKCMQTSVWSDLSCWDPIHSPEERYEELPVLYFYRSRKSI